MSGERIYHTFGPVYNENSKVLILGSMPSVRSLEQSFYYAHPQNRFWKVLAEVTGDALPQTVAEKKEFLLRHGIAVWDILASCRRKGSLDADIKDAKPNDIPALLREADIRMVYANGRTAEKYLKKFFPQISYTLLPSTSPANAGNFSLERWMEMRAYL